MRLRPLAAVALLALAGAACHKKPRTSPVPQGPSAADSAVVAQHERQRADSIAMAGRTRAEADRAERERAERERLAREQATSGVREALTAMVFFEYDSDEIGADAQSILQRKADILRANPSLRLRIEGHADERGSTEYNLALGQRRAEAVRAYFGEYGIDAGRFSTISYGKERPLVEGAGEEAWSRNRRAEFVIAGGEITASPQGGR
jgi:peptidoglycan-associated lipoprotein